MKGTINSYFGALLVTIIGSGATLLIIHIAYTNTFTTLLEGGETEYAQLRDSILEQQ